MLLEIGRVGRPHGLRGEVVVHLVTNKQGRLGAGTEVFCNGRALRVERSQALPGRAQARASWLVAFAGFETREQAEAIAGTVLLVEAGAGEDGLWVHELVGKTLRDQEGTDRGAVVALQANPASDLLVLEDGTLVPLRFVTAVGDGVVNVTVPAGLFEL